MPKLWSETVETHRHEVREAIQEAAARLVSEKGLRSVTMSQIAEETGIGRATLYKYYADVETILRGWHDRQIAHHLRLVMESRDAQTRPTARLQAALRTYGRIAREVTRHSDTDLAALLHRGHAHRAQDELHQLMTDLIRGAADEGTVRDDISADELATYCINALAAARALDSKAAVERLVEVTFRGLQASDEIKAPRKRRGARR